MSKQKKWWWEAVTSLTTSQKHRSTIPVVSPSIAQPPGASTSTHQIVLTGVDTLAVTAGGAVAPSRWLQEQAPLWMEYQQKHNIGDEYICIELDGKWWELYPSGSNPYKYQLRCDEVGYIKIWNVDKWSSGVTGKQQIHIHFYSKYLHQFPITSLYHEVKRLCSLFFDTDYFEILVSRGDIHTDVTNGNSFLTSQDIENVISRSKVRSHYYEDTELQLDADELDLITPPVTNNKGGQKLIPTSLLEKLYRMYNQQSNSGANQVIMKREIETAYFGKKGGGDLWCKMYNKTKQVKVKNDNDTPILWEQNGWNGKDVVVRVEFSIKRGALKNMDGGKYIPLSLFLRSIDTLWKYLTEKWCRMVEEVKTNNTTWSKVTQFWNVVASSFTKVNHTIIRKKVYKARVNQLFLQGIGCLKQMISVGMNTNDDICFIKSAVTAVENILISSIEDGEYYSRRQHLGLA